MRFTVEFRPDAVVDLAEALAWYDARSAVAGARLRSEVNAALNRIAESPAKFSTLEKETRRYLLKRYPYSVIYRLREQVVEVIAFAHHARGPNYMKRRLRDRGY